MIGLREDQHIKAQLVARIMAFLPPPPEPRVKPVAASPTLKAAG